MADWEKKTFVVLSVKIKSTGVETALHDSGNCSLKELEVCR